jgi:DnaJ-class molecular chaperone
MFERAREVCETCKGLGRVVDERQAGEPIATCMTCRGNGWVYADKKSLLQLLNPENRADLGSG